MKLEEKNIYTDFEFNLNYFLDHCYLVNSYSIVFEHEAFIDISGSIFEFCKEHLLNVCQKYKISFRLYSSENANRISYMYKIDDKFNKAFEILKSLTSKFNYVEIDDVAIIHPFDNVEFSQIIDGVEFTYDLNGVELRLDYYIIPVINFAYITDFVYDKLNSIKSICEVSFRFGQGTYLLELHSFDYPHDLIEVLFNLFKDYKINFHLLNLYNSGAPVTFINRDAYDLIEVSQVFENFVEGIENENCVYLSKYFDMNTLIDLALSYNFNYFISQ